MSLVTRQKKSVLTMIRLRVAAERCNSAKGRIKSHRGVLLKGRFVLSPLRFTHRQFLRSAQSRPQNCS